MVTFLYSRNDMFRPWKSNKRSRRCAVRGPDHLPVDRSRGVAQLLLGERDLSLYVKPANSYEDPPTGAAANTRDKNHGPHTSHVTNDYMTPQRIRHCTEGCVSATALQKHESVAPNVETTRKTGILGAEANLA